MVCFHHKKIINYFLPWIQSRHTIGSEQNLGESPQIDAVFMVDKFDVRLQTPKLLRFAMQSYGLWIISLDCQWGEIMVGRG